MVVRVTDQDLEYLRRGLLSRAYLYDDPAAYSRGVQDALRAIEALTTRPLLPEDPTAA